MNLLIKKKLVLEFVCLLKRKQVVKSKMVAMNQLRQLKLYLSLCELFESFTECEWEIDTNWC